QSGRRKPCGTKRHSSMNAATSEGWMESPTRARIVEALEATQHRGGGYLTQAALRALAAELGVPVYHLYGVATFFPPFRLEPPPPAPVAASVLRADPDGPGEPRYAALRKLVESGDVAGALATLKAAQLRGMGGAGFPAAVKWEAVRNATGDEKYVVCNADESEPGTIKDRGILTSVPHLVVEGMAVAGVLTGASRGIIYIRH